MGIWRTGAAFERPMYVRAMAGLQTRPAVYNPRGNLQTRRAPGGTLLAVANLQPAKTDQARSRAAMSTNRGQTDHNRRVWPEVAVK
jgi:hypothetical protein